MLNLANSTMAESVNDEVFDITDKNYQKVAKNLENVNFKIFQNISFVIVLFVNDVTLFCRMVIWRASLTDETQSFKRGLIWVMRTVSGLDIYLELQTNQNPAEEIAQFAWIHHL